MTRAMAISITTEVQLGIEQRDDIYVSWVLHGHSVYSIVTSSVFFVVSSTWFVRCLHTISGTVDGSIAAHEADLALNTLHVMWGLHHCF